MPRPQMLLELYLHLAKASEEQGRPLQQDKFLVLAASVAQKASWNRVAEECRRRVLKHNPNHILKRFPTMAEALESEDIRQYVRQLMRIYPFEKAEYLLDKFRASGYSGSHGYSLTLNPNGKASVGDSSAKSAPAPKNTSLEPPVNGNGPHTSVRPTLRKALAKPTSRAAAKAPAPQLEPLPLEFPNPSPQMSISYWTFFSWLIFVLAFGIAVGGAAVFYFHPPG